MMLWVIASVVIVRLVGVVVLVVGKVVFGVWNGVNVGRRGCINTGCRLGRTVRVRRGL